MLSQEILSIPNEFLPVINYHLHVLLEIPWHMIEKVFPCNSVHCTGRLSYGSVLSTGVLIIYVLFILVLLSFLKYAFIS